MKARYIIALLCSFSIISLSAAESKSCKCYCSVKCGPRDSHPGDKPNIGELAPSNNKYGMCFCAQRDLELFEKNGCKPAKEDIDALTCCQTTQEADQEAEESEEPIEE